VTPLAVEGVVDLPSLEPQTPIEQVQIRFAASGSGGWSECSISLSEALEIALTARW